ncbi:phage major capsid protein [Mycolicibacterium sp. 624]|uniref:phage major capsid protein n=1 Tax=Mycolicibacterium sp. 624 TaxID=3156314 RepID=UPI0033976351
MAIITTTLSASGWSPDVTEVAPGDAVPEALILQTSTVAGDVEGDAVAVHCVYVDDADAGFVPEGSVIPEDNPDLAQCTVFTGKIAQLIRLSREQYSHINTSEQLSVSVRRTVTRAANSAYIAQPAPVGPAVTPPAGLIHIPGLVDCGTITDDLDALVDGLAVLAGNYSVPTHILAAPDAWAALQKLKTGDDYNTSLLGAGTTEAQRFLFNLPVLVDPAVPSGTGIVVDRTAIVSAVGSVQVAVSDQAAFNSDSVMLRCTWRFGANIVRPERVGLFYLDGVTRNYNVSFGGASSGNATLTWRGRTTATIASNAANSAVKSALVALDDGYDASAWTVTGSAGSYVVTTPAGGALTGNGSGLVGGTGLTVT